MVEQSGHVRKHGKRSYKNGDINYKQTAGTHFHSVWFRRAFLFRQNEQWNTNINPCTVEYHRFERKRLISFYIVCFRREEERGRERNLLCLFLALTGNNGNVNGDFQSIVNGWVSMNCYWLLWFCLIMEETRECCYYERYFCEWSLF